MILATLVSLKLNNKLFSNDHILGNTCLDDYGGELLSILNYSQQQCYHHIFDKKLPIETSN
jgi:hypothetical protein